MKMPVPTCRECGCILDDSYDHSDPARRRYFAHIRDVWDSLPDHRRELHLTPKHLRKWALVKAGYCDTNIVNCGSKRAAIEVAAMAKRLDTFCVTDIRGSVVVIHTALSQTKRMQPRKIFLECAAAVERVLDDMIDRKARNEQETGNAWRCANRTEVAGNDEQRSPRSG